MTSASTERGDEDAERGAAARLQPLVVTVRALFAAVAFAWLVVAAASAV